MSDDLAAAIMALLARRRPGATICPSEVARAEAPENWRPLMPHVRAAAAKLAAAGRIEVTQRGVVVDPHTAHGPIRLRLP
jgi:hypothetical protein